MVTDLTAQNTAEQIIYSDALTYIAVGEHRDTALGVLIDAFPAAQVDTIRDIAADALRDALAQGVEREDIDPSWF